MFYVARQRGEIRWYDLNQAPGESAGPGELFAQIEVFPGSECGLLGLALDPDFESNGFVYIYATEPDPAAPEGAGKPRVIRFRDQEGTGVERTNLVDDLPFTNPLTCAHVGGGLAVGPHGILYLSLGNNEIKETSGDLSSPLGKILRLDKADGNPFLGTAGADPRIFAYGLRNPFAFAFHPTNGTLFVADNGPGNCDEFNLVEAGGLYGGPTLWPPALRTVVLAWAGLTPSFSSQSKGPTPRSSRPTSRR